MALMFPTGGLMAEDIGFTGADRKTLITVEVELGHVRGLLLGIGERTAVLERTSVTREEFRAAEIDIDSLRDEKADRSDLKALHASGVDTADDAATEMRLLRKDIENLQRWRWFERGIVATALALGEFVFHVLVK